MKLFALPNSDLNVCGSNHIIICHLIPCWSENFFFFPPKQAKQESKT